MIETLNKTPFPFLSESDRNKYLEELNRTELSSAPPGCLWSIDWPINPYLEQFHLMGYFGCPNPIMPQFSNPHWGIDIQTKAGVIVTSPENGRIVEISINEIQGLSDIVYLGDSNIYYVIGHLDPITAFEILGRNLLIGEGVKLEKRLKRKEIIGKVGRFSSLPVFQKSSLSQEVQQLFEGRIDHLHFGCFDENQKPINPIFLLKKLI